MKTFQDEYIFIVNLQKNDFQLFITRAIEFEILTIK